MQPLRQLFQLLERRDRFKLAVLGLLQFAASGLEVVGIAAILPFIQIVGNPTMLLEHEVSGPVLERMGLSSPEQIIWASSAALAVFFVAKSAFIAVSVRLFYGFIFEQNVVLATRLYEKYLRAPYLFHLRRNSARLVRNITQEVSNVTGTMLHGVSLPREILVSLGLVLVLFLTSSLATLAVVCLLGIFGFAVVSFTGKRLSRKGRVRVEQQARTIQSVNEGMGSIMEIKVLGRERHFRADLTENTRKLTDAMLSNVLFQQYPRLFIETMAGLAAISIVMIPLLSGQVLVDILPVLALFGVAFVRLIPSFNRIVQAINALRFASPSIAVLRDEMKIEPETAGGEADLRRDARIEVESVSYTYPDADVKALDDVTLTIEAGQTVSFVGPSGAGKTTLAGLLLGLLAPGEGRIRVDGVDLRRCIEPYRRNIGYIPQDIYLLDTTIRRNIAFGLPDEEIDDAAVWAALESAQLAAFVRSLPGQIDTIVGERGILISAGQRQRIGIARALYHDPPLLVLDEATSALDNETEREFADAVARLSSKTVIVIAHRLSTIRHSDMIHVLEGGRLVGSGTFETLRASNAVFRRLLGETPVMPLKTRAAV